MAANRNKSLRDGHRAAIGIEKDSGAAGGSRPAKTPRQSVPASNPLIDRYAALQDLPHTVIRKAWFTLAHLMLEPGATVVDMGCQGGMMAYAMALLSPESKIIGVDSSKRLIQQARENYSAPNLEFIHGDVGAPDLLPHESVDAIVDSFILHEIYSGAHYSDRSVVQMLENQFSLLKTDGILFIRDFAMPSVGEYVLMEMPDIDSQGPEPENMSEADLLVWYSEHARPKQYPGCSGFFLEELPPRFPKTRLFRLHAKWAYEFIMRKDERETWEEELHKEYTFFTEREYRKVLRAMGGRVLYTAPHWDDQYVKACFDGHFRLYAENGTPLGNPPTSFIAIAQKVTERSSLRLNERRPTANPNSHLRIQAMRNDIDGRMIDVISRDVSITEILPYRVTEDGNLHVFVHHGVPRGIVNAVPRNGRDLDGKRWSGHMTEAISVGTDVVSGIAEDDAKGAALFLRDTIGLKPMPNRTLERGPSCYPAPDFIDERIETRFIEVEKPSGPISPKTITPDIVGFSGKGKIVEMSAQVILNAISVGIIPNAQLELQILALYQKLGLKAEAWADTPLSLPEVDVQQADVKDLLKAMAETDSRYRQARGTSGQWKALQSIFVDEGQINGSLTGLASRDIDFIVSDETTENIAVVLPLVRNLSGEVLAGFVADYLPVPQRYKGSGFTVSAPMLTLPQEITTMEAARQYIADHFKVDLENVVKMGESFFCHIGLTPQRVYPFAMTQPVSGSDGPSGLSAYAPLEDLWKLMYWDNSKSFMKVMSLAYKNLGESSDLSVAWDFSKKMSATHDRPVVAQATDMRGLGGATPTSSPAPSSTTEDSAQDSGKKSGDPRKPLPK
ncbi:MAG: class I SAM-dependent methyltransferase [Micavibrio aeruginosavorus]|nr:class I SAM-dependent methyltransferase [Micavibrio aeruginosavorus]